MEGMSTPRDWMTLRIGSEFAARKSGEHAGGQGWRGLRRDDAEQLAVLMLESYRGSVDDSGETLADARGAVSQLLAGDFGEVDWDACMVAERDGGALASATIVTRDRVGPKPLVKGEAFLAFSMTAPGSKRQGLARAGLERLIGLLARRGERRLHLVVTRSNEPAVSLYQSLGFEMGPLGEG